MEGQLKKPTEEPDVEAKSDTILSLIEAALPNLPKEKATEIHEYLVEMGVETVDDLAFIEEEDLNKIVKPIQSRKLIAAWKNKGISGSGNVLPDRTFPAEPLTFVPAVFQINNMPSQSQNHSNSNRQVFMPDSETSQQNNVMQSIHIPGWRRKSYPESCHGNFCNAGSQGTSSSSSQKMHPDPGRPKDAIPKESNHAISTRQDTHSSIAWNQGTGLSTYQNMHPESNYVIPTMQDTNYSNAWNHADGLSASQKMHHESNYAPLTGQGANSCNNWSQGTVSSEYQKMHHESNYATSTRQDPNFCNNWSQGTVSSTYQKMQSQSSSAISFMRQDVNSFNAWNQESVSSASQNMPPVSNYVMPIRHDVNSSNKWIVSSASKKMHPFSISIKKDAISGNRNYGSISLPLPKKVYPKPVTMSRKIHSEFDYTTLTTMDTNSRNEWNQRCETSMAHLTYPESNYAVVPPNKNTNCSERITNSGNEWSRSSYTSVTQVINPRSNYAIVPPIKNTNCSDNISNSGNEWSQSSDTRLIYPESNYTVVSSMKDADSSGKNIHSSSKEDLSSDTSMPQLIHPEANYAVVPPSNNTNCSDYIANSSNEWSQSSDTESKLDVDPKSRYDATPSGKNTNCSDVITNSANEWNQSSETSVTQMICPDSKYDVVPSSKNSNCSDEITNSGNEWNQSSETSVTQMICSESKYDVIPSSKNTNCSDEITNFGNEQIQTSNSSVIQMICSESKFDVVASNKDTNCSDEIRNSGNEWNQSSDTSVTQMICPEAKYDVSLSNKTTNCSDEITNSGNEWTQSSDTSVTQMMCLESDYGNVASNKNTNFADSIEWSHKFEIPWDKMPVPIINFLSNKMRLNHVHKLSIVRLVCNQLFEVTNNPTQRDLEVIAKRMHEQFPESFCDSRRGKIQINEYATLMRQLRNRVEKMQTKLNPSSELDPSLTVAENQRRLISEGYGNESSFVLQPSNEDVKLKIKSVSSTNLRSVSSTASSDSVLENFDIPWHKMPSHVMDILNRKDKLTNDDRIQMIRILCDEIWKQRREKSGMEKIAKKIYENFPSFKCEGISDEKHLALQLRYRMRYLNKRLKNDKKIRQTQTNEVSSSQSAIEAESLRDSPDCFSSREDSLSPPPLEKIDNPFRNTEVVISSDDDSTDSMQDTTIPSSWAVSYKIPWSKMPEDLLRRLRNKERLTLDQKTDIVSNICEDILKIDPYPMYKNLRFIAEKASEEYPESLCDIVDGEPVGFVSLAAQLWGRIEDTIQTIHTVEG